MRKRRRRRKRRGGVGRGRGEEKTVAAMGEDRLVKLTALTAALCTQIRAGTPRSHAANLRWVQTVITEGWETRWKRCIRF